MLGQLFLTNRFFYVLGGLVGLFGLSFALPVLFPIVQTALIVYLGFVVADTYRIFRPDVRVGAERRVPSVLSLSDPNAIELLMVNASPLDLRVSVIDELPFQFQKRDFIRELTLEARSEEQIIYELRPLERGNYTFGNINLFLWSPAGFARRRVVLAAHEEVPVYPSIIQMKQLELRALSRLSIQPGIKKMRRIGHSYEFEQIKNYVRGDDYRSINWKATGRHARLMVNQYEDERSQQIYSLIDKSRAMRMPFKGLSLMDYAINATLAISNIALLKHDRAGLLSFSDKMGSIIKADHRPDQLRKILNALYRERERPLESNFELLYQATRRLISRRSLLLLYTNFESTYALDRVLPLLRRINTRHLLVVIFFENTEIEDFVFESADSIQQIYQQTTAQQFVAEKRKMVYTLRQYGIQAILTRPEELSINTVNKYLELKARGLI